jgi:hypothetical protein
MGHYTYANIIYGWRDEYGYVMSYETIEKIYETLGIWLESCSEELKYGTKTDAVYGIYCKLDEETGKIELNEEEKEKLKKAYDIWCDNKGIKGEELMYIKCISGDPEWHPDVELYDLEL